MSNIDEELDPVSPLVPQNFDRRLAELYVSTTENWPKEPLLTLTLKGHVAFGQTRHRGATDRMYQITLRQAFLEVATRNCQFEPNPAIDDWVQRGRVVDRTTSGTESEASLGGEVQTARIHASNNAVARVKAAWRRQKSVETHFDRLRARYVAGGFRIGEKGGGDPTSVTAVLDGVFLRGEWGVLRPSLPAQYYGASLKVVLPEGMLSVSPVQDEISDYLPMAKRKLDDDAFEGLKRAVAAWAIESHLRSRNSTDGYDNARGELILCHGEVDVDLSKVPSNATATNTGATSPNPTPGLSPSTRRSRQRSPSVTRTESATVDRQSE